MKHHTSDIKLHESTLHFSFQITIAVSIIAESILPHAGNK